MPVFYIRQGFGVIKVDASWHPSGKTGTELVQYNGQGQLLAVGNKKIMATYPFMARTIAVLLAIQQTEFTRVLQQIQMAGIITFTDYAGIIKEPSLANVTDVTSWHAGGGWHRLIANSSWR